MTTPEPSNGHYRTFSPDALHELSDDELDALPFGIIGLDADGRVARYNVAEARLARLDRSRVVGKSFFTEIARCAAVPTFQGSFERLLADASAPPCRFPFVFAFRFGSQNVDVELGRVVRVPFVYATINRRKFLPRDRSVDEGLEAPLLVELEPEAQSAGVVRDERGRRRLDLESPLLETLFATLRASGQGDHGALLRSWGEAWGRVAVVDMEAEALQTAGITLAEHTMAQAMDVVARYLGRQRLGRLQLDFAQAGRGAVVLKVERSVFAELGSPLACRVNEGLFAVILGHLARRLVTVREVRCARLGGASCDFIAVDPGRTSALERAALGLATAPAAAVDAVIAEVGHEHG
jgi:photoactive yellow protein